MPRNARLSVIGALHYIMARGMADDGERRAEEMKIKVN